MFSNGKFKNVVADVNESYQIKAGESYRKEYKLLPLKGKEKWSTHANDYIKWYAHTIDTYTNTLHMT